MLRAHASQLSPLRVGHAGRAAALLIATPVEPRAVPGAEVLQGLFDLTTAEARIARAIGEGGTIRDIAGRCGVSHETVRNQLKAVLAKTGLRRQAELAGLLGGLDFPAGGAGRGDGATLERACKGPNHMSAGNVICGARTSPRAALSRGDTSVLQTITPVVRSAVQVGDCQHQNVAVLNRVDQPIGKTIKPAAAHALIQQLPSIGMVRDAVRGGKHLYQEGVPQARSLRVIPTDRLIQLKLGDLKEADHPHGRYLARRSRRSFAFSSPRR
jgi:DNA-binding CsgD family transcriptional regulator